MSDVLRLCIDGPRADLELNRPERRNALNPALMRAIADAVATIEASDARVVVLLGAGEVFCAGADLTAFAAAMASEEGRMDAGRLGQRAVEAIESLSAVTIASVRGAAVGGGMLLATACDFRVAAPSTKFVVPEVDIGIPLGWGGVPRLVRELGPALARDLVMTCRPWTAEEAHRHGFVQRIGPLPETTEALVSTLLDKPSNALTVSKQQMKKAAEALASAACPDDTQLLVEALEHPSFAAAAARYIGKRA